MESHPGGGWCVLSVLELVIHSAKVRRVCQGWEYQNRRRVGEGAQPMV